MSELNKDMFCHPMYERALLSYCLRSLDHYYMIAPFMEERDFLNPEHRLLFVIIKHLVSMGAPKIDASMIVNESEKSGVLESIGGYDYLMAIMDMELSEGNVQFYLDKVINSSTKYKLYLELNNSLKNVADSSDNEDINAHDLITMSENGILTLSMKSRSVKEPTNMSDGIRDYLQDRRDNPVELCGISTGFPSFDKLVDGLIPKTLTVICARPKHGKSTFLMNIGAHVAYVEKKPVLVVDTEMSFEEFRPRLLAMLSGVPERKIKHGGFNDQEWYNLCKAADIIEKGKLFHEFMPGYSLDKITSLYKKYKNKEDIGVGIFDYIKTPSGEGFKEKKEYQILGDVTTALKDLAGVLGIPFLVATQVNRQQDIADSDRILRYANVIAFLKRKTVEEVEAQGIKAGNYKLVISESRHGGTTTDDGICLDFIKRCLLITESSQQVMDFDKERQEKDEYGEPTRTEFGSEAEESF